MASCWKVVVIDKNVWRIGGNILIITSYKDEHYTEDAKLTNNLLSYWRLKNTFWYIFLLFLIFAMTSSLINSLSDMVHC